MSEPTQDPEPVVIEIETERVDGVIDLDDMVGVVRALQEEAARPQLREPLRPGGVHPGFGRLPSFIERPGRPGQPGRPARPGQPAQPEQAEAEVEERLQVVNRLAGELAEQLAALARLQR